MIVPATAAIDRRDDEDQQKVEVDPGQCGCHVVTRDVEVGLEEEVRANQPSVYAPRAKNAT